MNQRTIVITGASDGIGRAAAEALSRRGDTTVVIVGRNAAKTAEVGARLGVEHHVCDYTRLDDVRALAATLLASHPSIDVLANNAGGVFAPRTVTPDGYETTLQVNHLAPLLLTQELLPALKAGEGTVVFTASRAAFQGSIDLRDLGKERGWSSFGAYGAAKLANIVTAKAMQHRYGPEGITTASFHPGVVATSFGSGAGRLVRFFYASGLGKRIMRTPEQGADTLVWLATTKPGVDWRPGAYYADRRLTDPPKQALDDAFCDRFLEASELLIR
ncbi:MAG TPA: SDR family NAD(P)-dependent oxidoreductase [Propionibacteriaceae bacterium]|nr:SDR family NAD(P)-dependent oxidoreductase [Propionibacteriaceae bacterium]